MRKTRRSSYPQQSLGLTRPDTFGMRAPSNLGIQERLAICAHQGYRTLLCLQILFPPVRR